MNQQGAVVIIVGVLGSIGRVITNQFLGMGERIIGIDIMQPQMDAELQKIVFRSENILQPSNATLEDLARADMLVFAVSYEVITKALPFVAGKIPSHCLLIDTLSIKTPFWVLVQNYKISHQSMGINPMFSGDLDPQGRPVAVVTYQHGEAVENFLTTIQSWGMEVIPLGIKEHDQLMAAVQSLGHALLIAFGKALVNSGIDPHLMNAIAPPPFRLLLTLLARLTQNHPDVYWEIQADNPYSQHYRALLRQALVDVETHVSLGDKEGFQTEFALFKSTLVNQLPEFSLLGKKVFGFIHECKNTDQLKEIG